MGVVAAFVSMVFKPLTESDIKECGGKGLGEDVLRPSDESTAAPEMVMARATLVFPQR